MARYLLDSDVVIRYIAGMPPTVALIAGFFAQGDRLCSCDVVIAEVYSGMRPERARVTTELLASMEYLTTSARMAAQAGSWRYDFFRLGRPLATTDVLIAATAFTHGATVVTGNVRDYPMPEVSLLPLPR
jgi:predicted nucleic acid-binding protein